MSSSPLSSQLPFLPGYRVEIDKKDRHHKTHFFDVQNHTRMDNSLSINYAATQPPITPHLSTTQSIQKYHSSFPTATTTMSRLPAWVAYDRKVLRFYGYFKESVHSSPQETWRVRKCVIYLYLEDESIHIAEPKIENSGIPQGVFVKRHRIPRAGGEGTYGVENLKVGAEIVVYGRVFRLVDADAFTRDFYAHNGIPLASPESYPLDAFTLSSTSKPVTFNKLMHPHKQYMEASLGKPMLPSAQATQQFLQMDGHVLRFYAQWDDEKMYGEKKPYVIHYYLADDTIEVQEIQQPNSGRDPFPTLLKRQKLAKNWSEAVPNVARLGLKHEELTTEYYTKEDFRIGASIYVYGRQLLICGADECTKNYYAKNYGLSEADFKRINMEDPEEEIAKLTPPPYNGYGTEEDSLGSFLYLMPKVPKADFKKLMQNDGINLRFLAKLIHPGSKVDRDRRFIVTFYCASDQLSLFEKFDRNSGFIGGKFLEKSRLKNPSTGEWFKASDFYVGARVKINAYEFEICEEDEFTRKWTVGSNGQPQQISPKQRVEESKSNEFAQSL